MWTTITIVGIILLIILFVVGIYNRLITLRNQVNNSWAQIEVQLQRRYDLIPNLVETVKGYMAFEKGTLEAVINARNTAIAAKNAVDQKGGPTEGSIKGLVGAEISLKRSLGDIFALAENYPQLKANETMQNLQEELSSTENKVAFARQAYNDQAMAYNTAQQEIPANLLAAQFGHKLVELYEIEDANAKKAVKVSF